MLLCVRVGSRCRGWAGAARGAAAVLGSSFVLAFSLGSHASAAERGSAASEGLALARSGDCVSAVPILEQATQDDPKPSVTAALAACEVALGELLLAYDRYRELAEAKPSKRWSKADREAHAQAAAKRDELDFRLPRLRWEIAPLGAEPSGTVSGRPIDEWGDAMRVPADEPLDIAIAAPGFEPFRLRVVLAEGEERTVPVRLVASGAAPPAPPPPPQADRSATTHWLGARFRGVVFPEFLTDLISEGGRTTFWPGGAVTYTAGLGDVDVVVSLQAMTHPMSSTPFKPKGTPDTEWEVIESDLWSGVAAVDVLYRIELDDAGDVALRMGAGLGIGWAFAGEVRRWQSFSPSGEPGDPYSYPKCRAPNDPVGSFRYCNQLDKDANRYGDPDTSWFDGGLRPTFFPWIVLPEIGLDVVIDDDVGLELEVGATPTGLLTGVGVRFGL